MPEAPDIADFCRQIETYLCQKNEGHLIRVVGPSFDLVAGWAAAGVPLKVAFRGIDRTVDRHARKGPRRRPLKIDFCEADVLDVFDEWRRATGVTAAASADAAETHLEKSRPGSSLPEHLKRALLRLTDARTSGRLDQRADSLIDRVAAELDTVRLSSRSLRGEARAALLARLDAADQELLALMRDVIPAEEYALLQQQTDEELSAFRAHMQPDDFARAREAAIAAAARARLKLPVLSFS